MTSRLIYYGTNEEMQVGDRVRIRWHSSEKLCVVSEIGQYTSGSPSEIQRWEFRTDDGVLHAVDNETGGLGKHIQLVCHAGKEVDAVVTALGCSSEKNHPLSWLDAIDFVNFGCSIYVLFGLVGSILVWLLS